MLTFSALSISTVLSTLGGLRPHSPFSFSYNGSASFTFASIDDWLAMGSFSNRRSRRVVDWMILQQCDRCVRVCFEQKELLCNKQVFLNSTGWQSAADSVQSPRRTVSHLDWSKSAFRCETSAKRSINPHGTISDYGEDAKVGQDKREIDGATPSALSLSVRFKSLALFRLWNEAPNAWRSLPTKYSSDPI